MTIIHWPQEKPAIVRTREEQDRWDCVALDKKVDGANRELAQWLIDHPTYPNTAIAEWLGCDETRIRRLRKWAKGGFVGLHQPQHPRNSASPPNGVLKTKDNFEDDEDLEPIDDEDPHAIISDGVEHAEQVAMNAIDTIKQSKAVAEAYRKIFKRSNFDREAKAKIYNEITKLIVKWRAVQSTLDPKKGNGNG